MFKWPNPLPVRPTEVEQADFDELVAWQMDLADFSEFISWQGGSASDTHISRQLAKAEENDHTNGVPATDELFEEIQDAFGLVGERLEYYGSAYPFELDESGRSLQLRPHGDSPTQTVYKYLLLATRLDMNENRKHGGIDGPDLFEQLCAEVASQYFGKGSRSLVFGTSSDLRSFPDRVVDLCEQTGEGNTFRNNSGGTIQAKDDGLDVVVWNPFADPRKGKLMGFGQCKTGTHYEQHFTRLQPDAFCGNWFDVMPTVYPVRMFFMTDALPEERWEKRSRYAGIIFDRSRLVDLCENISTQTLAQISTWTQAAAVANGLPGV